MRCANLPPSLAEFDRIDGNIALNAALRNEQIPSQ